MNLQDCKLEAALGWHFHNFYFHISYQNAFATVALQRFSVVSNFLPKKFQVLRSARIFKVWN